MQTAGIFFGLGAALSQSACYVFTRLYVIRHHHAPIRLLVTGHILMGLFSLVAMPFVAAGGMPPMRSYALPLAGAVVFYLLGQTGLFVLMRRTQASRVAPLLGIKIVILALITVLAMHQPLAPRQWVAVLLCTAAAFVLSRSGESLTGTAVLWVIATCAAYSLSDLSITALVRSLQPLSPTRAALAGVCRCYLFCGLAGLAFMPFAGGRRVMEDWPLALGFAAFWYLGMLFLYACFASIGPVFGNVLQSTRGIISVVLGACLARLGHIHIEQRVSRGVLGRRVAAAVLMCGAIWLFAS